MENVVNEVAIDKSRLMAELALERYRIAKEAKQKAAEQMKLAEAELKGLAETNEAWFTESKTCNMEGGKLKWVASSSVNIEKDRIGEFAAAYPMAVKITPSLSQVKKVLEIRTEAATVYGIEIKDNDLKFAVEV